MPSLKYSGSKGIVQSTGSGAFQLSGVGVSHDVQTITNVDTNITITSHGTTIFNTVTGNRIVTVPNPPASTHAGQQKLIVSKAVQGGATAEIKDENGEVIFAGGVKINAANEYCLLVWTGSSWIPIATNIN